MAWSLKFSSSGVMDIALVVNVNTCFFPARVFCILIPLNKLSGGGGLGWEMNYSSFVVVFTTSNDE